MHRDTPTCISRPRCPNSVSGEHKKKTKGTGVRDKFLYHIRRKALEEKEGDHISVLPVQGKDGRSLPDEI